MELVEGVSLQHVLETAALDMPRALKVLDEVLDGLATMHAAELGHLDLKPSNVVLRHGGEAVLVDFGLAGRHIRPGCTTGPYGAPEVWGVVPNGVRATPMTADVYAFGCLAFEALTGRTLFAADSEAAQIGMHLTHDGQPPAVLTLSQRPGLGALGSFLRACLRRSPKDRPTATELRAELAPLRTQLARHPWPLPMT
jgi:serine/threonine protein kinase